MGRTYRRIDKKRKQELKNGRKQRQNQRHIQEEKRDEKSKPRMDKE